MRGVNAGRIDTAAPAALPVAAETEPEVTEDVPTVWQRSEATGAVWRTADEAATGVRGATRLPASETRGTGAIFRDEADQQGPADPAS
jgi:hypothetical protein